MICLFYGPCVQGHTCSLAHFSIPRSLSHFETAAVSLCHTIASAHISQGQPSPSTTSTLLTSARRKDRPPTQVPSGLTHFSRLISGTRSCRLEKYHHLKFLGQRRPVCGLSFFLDSSFHLRVVVVPFPRKSSWLNATVSSLVYSPAPVATQRIQITTLLFFFRVFT